MGTLGKVSLVASFPVQAARKLESEQKHRHRFVYVVYVQLSVHKTQVHVIRMHVKII